jgi:two-component system chemotaxis response regulator CheB
MIRVLIVDDSAVLRQSTRFILESDPELRVIGEAGDGAEAVALAERLRPDVITMDIRMPKMDGLEAIRWIMAEHPAPIVIVTSLDLDRELGVSLQAAKLGAVAVLKRPSRASDPMHKAFAAKLIEQVKLMSAVKVIQRTRAIAPAELSTEADHPAPAPMPVSSTRIVAIGSSTGGPAALYRILGALPADWTVPILVVQHISFGFVEGLASWLDKASPLCVKVAQPGERIQSGIVYIAPDDHHLLIDRRCRIVLSQTEPVGGHRPSVTPLFQSVAQTYGPAAMSIILTGMGADGAVGMQALYQTGAITIAQDESSCVVFGMPKEAIALGAVQHIVPLDQIAQKMMELCVV